MDGKPAKPDRYIVSRTGTQDPANTQYFVLDIVNDFDARVALAFLGRSYERRGMPVRSQEAFQALEDSVEAHKAAVEGRYPGMNKPRGRGRPRNGDVRP